MSTRFAYAVSALCGRASGVVLSAFLAVVGSALFSSVAFAQAGSLTLTGNPCALPGPDAPDRCRVGVNVVKPGGAFAACLWTASGTLVECQGLSSWSTIYSWVAQGGAGLVAKSHSNWPGAGDFNTGTTFGTATATVASFPADAYEVDDTPTLSTPGLNGAEPPQQRNFHVANDTDWALYWLGAGYRSTVTLQPVTTTSTNRWRAELYYTEAGDQSLTRTLVMTRTFGVGGTTLTGDSLPSAGRAFWVKVQPVDGSFFGAASPYRLSVSGEALPAPTVSVSLTAPANGTSVGAPATISLSANASVSSGTINRVEFYRSGSLIGTDTSAPYTATDANVSAGNYSYTAKAFDNASPVNSATSAAASVTVTGYAADAYEVDDTPSLSTPPINGNDPPQQRNFHIANDNDWAIYWLIPAARSVVTLQPVTATATNRWRAELYYTEDGDTSLTRTLVMTRDFGVAGTTLTGDSLPTAGRAFWVKVRPLDASFYGAASRYTMSVAGQPLPGTVSVSLTAPANNATFAAPATINLAANASVAGGTVQRVEFYRGPSLLCSDATAPYECANNTIGAGSYSYTAKAYSTATPVTSATSTAVNVTVTGYAADAYEVDDTPSLSTPPINGNDPPQQRNFHIANDNDWALYWLIPAARSIVTLQPVTSTATNRWRAELYYTEDGDASLTRTLVMMRDFGVAGTTLTGDSLPTAGRAFWVKVRPLDGTFYGAASRYTMSVGGEVLPGTVSVSLTAPANNATFTAPASINLSATASVAGGTVQRVEFYRGPSLLCSDATAPYECADTNVAAGSYSYTAKAYSTATPVTSATSTAVNVAVSGFAADSYEIDDTPAVSSTPPLNGNDPPQQRNFHIANDNDWAIYWLGQNLRSVVTLQPVRTTGTNRWRAELYSTEAGDASYTRTLVMTRDFGITGTTLTGDSLPTAGRAFWVRVRPVDSGFIGAPTAYTMSVAGSVLPSALGVSLTSPANNSTFSAPATINLVASASAGSSAITRVEFYRGATLVCTDTGTPYECTDTGVALGSYSYTAKVFDATTTVTSTPVNVTVTSASAGLPPALSPAGPSVPTSAEILASSRVGTLDGALRVSETGAVNFSVDFLTAPGKGGLAPDLGLAYTGDANLGVAGIGFNITGLSGVSRCRKTQEAGDGPGPHPQVNFDSNSGNDAFCLDGQRLLVAGSGTQSIDGVAYPYTEYRTELESFQRIRGYSSAAGATGEQLVYGPLFWRVEGKDGSVREFGRDYSDLITRSAALANTGVLGNFNDPSTGLKMPARLITDGRMHVLSWSISAQSDRLGNRIRFRYETGYTGSAADPYISHYLSRVFYTGFTGAPASFEHAALAFDYAPVLVAKVQRGWVAGSYSVRNVELQTVRSCLRANPAVAITADEVSSSGTSLCNSLANTLRVYALGYAVQADQNEDVTTNPTTLDAGKYGSGRRRLSTLKTCADTAQSICWPATTLGWSQARAGFDFFNTTMSGMNFQRASGIRFSDITGDGKPDIVWREELTDNQPDKLRFNRAISSTSTGNGITFSSTIDITKVPDALDNNLYGNDPDRNWGLLDVNGDGIEDLINTESVANDGGNNFGPWGWFVRLGTGTDAGFSSARSQLEGTSSFSGAAILAQFQFTDTDGDGTVDMLSPKEVGGRTMLQVAKGQRQGDGRLVFATPVEVQLDFGGGPSGCYRIGFGRKHRADRWDSYDFNGDSLADLTLRVQNACAGLDTGREKPKPPFDSYQFGLEPEPVLRINKEEENGPNNPAANLVEWGVFASQNLANFKLLLMPTGVADTEGALRPTDLNGDGLLDLVKQEGQYGRWKYQLNNGNGVFGTEYCLLVDERWVRINGSAPLFSQTECFATRLPNSSNQLISTGQILLQDFDGDGFTDVWHSEEDPINQQSSGGRRFRVYRWKGAEENGSFNCTIARTQCTDYEHRKYVSVGSTGEDLLTLPSGVWTNAIGGNSGDWRHVIADIDNDGYGDSFAYKKDAGVNSAGYMLVRSTDHHTPRDVLSSITSGYGATTTFVYSPMSYTSVYTRDYDGNELRTWGRGSSVADVVAPSYLVSSMSTPAPLAGNPGNLAWMHYRYQGLKAQTGGRGSLGFRKIYTLNAQNSVETATQYHQMFPLTGRPQHTESRALNATGVAKWRLNCNPDVGPTATNACFYPTPQCKGGTCPHFSGDDDNAAVRGQILARNSDLSAWRSRAPGSVAFGAQNAALPTGAPASVFTYTVENLSERFESSGELANLVIASTRSRYYSTPGVSGYDNYGNLLNSVVESFAGSASGSAEKTVSSTSVYTNIESSWQLGQMTSTSITHTRPGRDPVTRSTSFAYDANGQLRMERVQPGSSEFQYTKYTERHRYGMPTQVYSCSKAVEDASQCSVDFGVGNTRPAGVDARLWVYRYAQTDYDEVTGLPTVSYALRNNGGSPQLVVASQTDYDKWGNPRLVSPTDGAPITTTFDAFGRAVHQYTATGAQTTTLLARCDGSSVRCPANAVTRTYSFSAGGPKQWAYSDALGRGIANLSQMYKQGEYSVRYAEFDGLGRQVRQTEPSMTNQGPEQANALPSSSSLPSTESCYDVGGRVTYVKLPNHAAAFSCANPPSAAQITNPTPDNLNVSQTIYRGLLTETINGLGQAQKITVNSLGETVRSEDANAFVTDFAFDAVGNLTRVTRGAGTVEQSSSSMLYDDMGRRSLINDPSTGSRRSIYTPAGEAVREIDAKGQCLQHQLDFNGRVIQTEEYVSSSGTSCSGAVNKVITHTFDRDRLGALASSRYGLSSNPTEAGSVRIDQRYDSYSRPVSTQRCIAAVTLSRNDALNCKVEQQGYDQYGRPYWSVDASSENLLHSDNPYAAGGATYRGVRQYYSEDGTVISTGVTIHAGFAYKTTNLDGSKVYYETLASNARAQVTQERVDGKTQFTTTRGYEASTGRLLSMTTGSLQNQSVSYDELGNLRSRTDLSAGRNLVESFNDYDSLNRVKKAELRNAGTLMGELTMSYSSDGNITAKTGTGAYSASHIGSYNYGSSVAIGSGSCAAGSVHAVRAISDTGYCYDANGNQTQSLRRSDLAPQRIIGYSLFNKPGQIDSYEVGGSGHSTRYGYGPVREMAYRVDVPQYAGPVSSATVEVQYFGAVERELRKTGVAGQTKETYKRMIAGVLQIVEERTVNETTAAVIGSTVTLKTEVILKDHLGSTFLIVNSDGSDSQYQRFDVWGMRADASTGSTQTLTQSYGSNNPNDPNKARTRKGFTGHEMVDGAGIVHMQGRIYDPRLGRFLQADPVIQDPLNAQNYNRYTYVYNNPLSLTDPSGYRSISANLELYWKPIVAIVIIVVTGGQAAAALGTGGAGAGTALAWTVAGGAGAGLVTTGTLKGTLMGAVDSLLTFGIGQAFKGSWKALVIAHSLKGGMLEAMNGGDFGHGVISAGLSKMSGIGVDELDLKPAMEIVVQSIAGGTISAATGGKFANGAVSAALQFAFNQALSSGKKAFTPVDKRGLTEGEIAMLETTLGTGTPWHTFTISLGDTVGDVPAKAIGTNITFDPDGGWYMDDFSASLDTRTIQTFFHEFNHLYEYHHETKQKSWFK